MTIFIVLLVIVVAGLVATALFGYQTVPTGKIGVVYNRYGSVKHEKHLVRVHGGRGVQAATLQSDRRYLLPPLLYRIRNVPRTYVPTGTIGLVIAKVGAVSPVERTLCEYVECDWFQDGRKFLLRGGQMGKQLKVLPGGAYYDINPALFEVLTTETLGAGEKYELTRSDLMDISIPEGATGVVIAKEGDAPDDDDNTVGPIVPGHASFQKPWEFLSNGGRRGAQAETLSHGGVYRINPWFARVVIIPTRSLTLDWQRSDTKSADRYDAALDQIVANVEGHRLLFTMTQIIRIPAKAAPRLVRRFGEDRDMTGLGDVQSPAPVQRFVERVLGRTVKGYFESCASEYEVLQFIVGLNEVRMELESKVAEALAEWGVEAGRTTLSDFESEDPELDARRRQRARERDEQESLEYRLRNAEVEERINRLRIETARAEAAVPVAESEARAKVWGVQSEVLLRSLEQLKDFNTPSIMTDASAVNGALPLVVGQEMINQTLKNLPQDPPPQLKAGDEDEPPAEA